jgi:hypothetical protein
MGTSWVAGCVLLQGDPAAVVVQAAAIVQRLTVGAYVRRQDLAGLVLGDAVHDRVVGIAFELHARVVPGQPGIERVVHEQVRQHR